MWESIGSEWVGVADVYHVWFDERLEEEGNRRAANKIFGFHVCDWNAIPITC